VESVELVTSPPEYEDFYRREYPAMVALAAAVSGSFAAAEDLAQEALTRAFRRWGRISTYDRPGAWLRRVTINLALSRRRRLASEARLRLRLGGPPLVELPEGDETHVWIAVRRLPARQRAAIALYYLEDRSVAEIADILGCSEATIRVHLHRGRTKLATMLEHDP